MAEKGLHKRIRDYANKRGIHYDQAFVDLAEVGLNRQAALDRYAKKPARRSRRS